MDNNYLMCVNYVFVFFFIIINIITIWMYISHFNSVLILVLKELFEYSNRKKSTSWYKLWFNNLGTSLIPLDKHLVPDHSENT